MKKLISIILIFTLLVSSANAFFFFGYNSLEGFKNGGESAVDFTGSESNIDFTGSENAIDFSGSESAIDFIGGESDIDFTGNERPVDFTGGESEVDFNGNAGLDSANNRDLFNLPETPNFPGDLPIIPPKRNLPAEWNSLSDVSIPQGSPDNTVVYSNLKSFCSDPDDEEVFRVASKHENFDLFFSGNDLVIRNLNKDYFGKDKVVVSCNNVKASFFLTISKLPVKTNIPARWLPLDDVVFDSGISDGTVIYHNLASRCVDPDSPKVINVSWPEGFFSLYFDDWYNLLIRNVHGLLSGHDYSFRIDVSCNGVPASFHLKILDVSRNKDSFDSSVGSLGERVFVSSIFIPNQDNIRAGSSVPIAVVFKSDEDLENVKLSAIIAELGVRSAVGPFDVEKDKKVSKTLSLDIPEWTAPGSYYIRFSLNGRVIYREIKIIE